MKETTPITIENFPRVQYHPWETAAGYNPLRGEFSTEWNSHVEDDLHTLSFLPTDSENDRGLWRAPCFPLFLSPVLLCAQSPRV